MGNVKAEQPQISIAAYGLSATGKQRAINEDALLLTDFANACYGTSKLKLDRLGERGTLLAVADGMGVVEAGEVASAMAVTVLYHGLRQATLPRVHSEQLRQVVEYANACIWRHARQNPPLRGMGTTLTAALVRGEIAYLAQVGDSRAYLIRGGGIRQLTKDQSLMQNLLNECLLFPEELMEERGLPLPVLGANPDVEVTLGALALEREDYLLLCSDGLSNQLTAVEMQQIVQRSDSPASACHRLTELAHERGGEDNVSVIVAQFAGEGLYQASKKVA